MEGEKTETHWRKKDNPNYLGAYSMPMPRKDVILTIKDMTWEKVTGEGGKTDQAKILYFEENVKPMILNMTNGKTIASIYKSPAIEVWKGKKIQLFVDWIKDRSSGLMIECLRIRHFEPQVERPTLLLDSPAFKKCKAHIEQGGSVDDIEKKYILSFEIKTALCSSVKKD